jgi:hypothetical protein
MPKTYLISLLFLPVFTNAQKVCDCDSAFKFIYAGWAEVGNMSYHSFKNERKIDVYEQAEFDFVVQRSPYKVAGLMTEKGHRLLYDPLQNRNDALYISNGFPYTNLWLDINGKIFRGLNHYTISNAGCEYIFGIIQNEYRKMPDKFICRHILTKGHPEIEIYASTDDFYFTKYTGLKGENVLDISDKLKVMAYVLIEYNEYLDGYLDDCSGLTINVPTHYGSTVKLVVDAKHGMPTLIEVSDKKGLLEQYIYSNYSFNKKLPKDYFTESYLDGL